MEGAVLPSGRALPYVRLEDVGGARAVALPFSDYLPISDVADAIAGTRLLGDVAPAAQLTLKTALGSADAHRVPGARVSREAVLHVLLPGAGPSKRLRVNARRAERDGVTVRRRVSPEALATFYELFARLRIGKFGSIPQPRSFFEAVYGEFVARGRGYFLEAVFEGRVIASLCLLKAGGRLYYKFGASSLEALAPRPNHLLFRTLLDELHEGRYAAIDLGLSGAGPTYAGLRDFKSMTGATAAPLHYLEVTPVGYDPAPRRAHLARLSAVTRAMTEAGLSTQQLSRLSEAIYPSFA